MSSFIMRIYCFQIIIFLSTRKYVIEAIYFISAIIISGICRLLQPDCNNNISV